MAGEIFYPPPAPVQPAPHVPIPAQGQQPPRRTWALMMSVVMASHPTGLEYQAPRKVPTVPIPAQGDQPPRYSVNPLMQLVRSWDPPDPQPAQKPLKVAPLTLTYGDQPPKYAGFLADTLEILRAWDPPPPDPWQLPRRPPIPTPGSEPPRYAGNLADYLELVRAWDPPDPQPQQRPTTAPIPPPLLSQPPPRSIVVLGTIIDAWRPPDPQPWQRPPTVPIPAQGDQPPRLRQPLPYSLWVADPPLPQPTEQAAAIIPPPVVSQVPFTRPLSIILGAWDTADPVRQRAVNFPIRAQGQQVVCSDPRWVRLLSIVRQWDPPDPMPRQRPLTVAPLTLIYGQQPPPRREYRNVIYDSWLVVDVPRQPVGYALQPAPAPIVIPATVIDAPPRILAFDSPARFVALDAPGRDTSIASIARLLGLAAPPRVLDFDAPPDRGNR